MKNRKNIESEKKHPLKVAVDRTPGKTIDKKGKVTMRDVVRLWVTLCSALLIAC
jgi:hypothetical protein